MLGRLLLVALCLCAASFAKADDIERFDSEMAQKIGKALTEATNKITDLPVKLALNEKQATGFKAKNVGLLIVPDSKLTADALKKIDKEVLPVGVLYLRKMTPVVADEPVPADKQREIEVTVGTNSAVVTVMPLAATRVAGRLVLLGYAKGKTPALVTDLVEIDEKIDLPVEVTARKAGDNRGMLVVNALGKYRATILMAPQE